MRLPLRCLATLLCLVPLSLSSQALSSFSEDPDVELGLRVTVTKANLSPGACGCFWLTGGAGDIAIPLWHAIRGVVEVAGNTTARVPDTTRGLSTITLLAGPQYSLSLPHRQAVSISALGGAVRGFDAEFRRGPVRQDTATAYAFALGGAYAVPLFRHTQLRVIDLQYLRTALPNGSDDRQSGLRIGAGLVFRAALPSRTR